MGREKVFFYFTSVGGSGGDVKFFSFFFFFFLKASLTLNGMQGSKVSVAPDKNKDLKKQHFVVKIQIPLDTDTGETLNNNSPLTIYNKDKSFCTSMFYKGNEELHRQLYDKIKFEGHHGIKGYFHTILEPGDLKAKQFRINPENIFIEPW